MDPDELADKIGQKVRSIREGKDLNQEEVAEEANYSTSAISKIENGDYDLSLNGLERVMNAVGKEIEDVRFGELGSSSETDE